MSQHYVYASRCQIGCHEPHWSIRQGFNRYFPPDFDPQKHGTLNAYHGKHALGDRARKIDKGILIVRFELPFNIWWYAHTISSCSPHLTNFFVVPLILPAEHATIILAWAFGIMQKRRELEIITLHLYGHSDANAICAKAGLRFKRTPRYSIGRICCKVALIRCA